MSFTVTPRSLGDGKFILDLQGEVDLLTSPLLREAILDRVEENANTLLINLKRVDYLDSTGLGILIGGLKRMKEQGGTLVLYGPSARVQRLLEITGLTALIDIHATEEEALSATSA